MAITTKSTSSLNGTLLPEGLEYFQVLGSSLSQRVAYSSLGTSSELKFVSVSLNSTSQAWKSSSGPICTLYVLFSRLACGVFVVGHRCQPCCSGTGLYLPCPCLKDGEGMVEALELGFRFRGRASPQIKEAMSLNVWGAAWWEGQTISPGCGQTWVSRTALPLFGIYVT